MVSGCWFHKSWYVMAVGSRHSGRSGVGVGWSSHHKHEAKEARGVELLNLLHHACITQASPNSTTNWWLSVQIPETMETFHSNHLRASHSVLHSLGESNLHGCVSFCQIAQKETHGVMEVDAGDKWEWVGRNKEKLPGATLKPPSFPHSSIVGAFLADICPVNPPGK